ncbi:MAG TPA: hypothetical protein VJH89_03155 [Patescibacteria group bacterium]|nr:hypothetical protein [Patescibacteria group bacterium]
MTIVQKICDGIQRIVEQLCGIEDDNDDTPSEKEVIDDFCHQQGWDIEEGTPLASQIIPGPVHILPIDQLPQAYQGFRSQEDGSMRSIGSDISHQ